MAIDDIEGRRKLTKCYTRLFSPVPRCSCSWISLPINISSSENFVRLVLLVPRKGQPLGKYLVSTLSFVCFLFFFFLSIERLFPHLPHSHYSHNAFYTHLPFDLSLSQHCTCSHVILRYSLSHSCPSSHRHRLLHPSPSQFAFGSPPLYPYRPACPPIDKHCFLGFLSRRHGHQQARQSDHRTAQCVQTYLVSPYCLRPL